MNRWLPVLALTSFAALLFWATADGPAKLYAQQDKKADYNAKKKAKQQLRPIPGASSTLDVAALAKVIDDEVSLRLQKEKLHPSPKTDDSEFIRRVTLDITGVIPTADKVRAFLQSKIPTNVKS